MYTGILAIIGRKLLRAYAGLPRRGISVRASCQVFNDNYSSGHPSSPQHHTEPLRLSINSGSTCVDINSGHRLARQALLRQFT